MKEIKSVTELDYVFNYWVFHEKEEVPAIHPGYFIFKRGYISDKSTRVFGPIPKPTLEEIEKQCEEE